METENTDSKKSKEQLEKERQERRKKILNRIAFVCLIIIIIVLLLRSCGNGEKYPDIILPDDTETQGDFNIGDKRPTLPQDSSIVPESITFSGSDKYTVSPSSKEIELTNPEVNQANFVFTVTDKASGEVIAKTGKVAPGQYVYINIFDHYQKAGNYDITVEISVFSYGGSKLNGASAKAVVTVLSE